MTPQERANSIFEGRGSHQLAKDTLKAIIAAENDAIERAAQVADEQGALGYMLRAIRDLKHEEPVS